MPAPALPPRILIRADARRELGGGHIMRCLSLAGALKAGHLPLVILAAINTAIAIYYYLSVVRISYCTDPEERPAVAVAPLTQAVSIVLVLVIIVMGIMPAAVVDIATAAVRGIM